MDKWTLIPTAPQTKQNVNTAPMVNGLHEVVKDPSGNPIDTSTYDAILLRVHIDWIKREEGIKPTWPFDDWTVKRLVLAGYSQPMDNNSKLGAIFGGRAMLGQNFFRPARRVNRGVPAFGDPANDFDPNEKFKFDVPPAVNASVFAGLVQPDMDSNSVPYIGLFAEIYATQRTRATVQFDGDITKPKRVCVTGYPPIGQLHYSIGLIESNAFQCNYSHQVFGFKSSMKGPPQPALVSPRRDLRICCTYSLNLRAHRTPVRYQPSSWTPRRADLSAPIAVSRLVPL